MLAHAGTLANMMGGLLDCLSYECQCRMVRHDLIGELCDSALRFHQAGGVSAALPKRVTSGRANLRKGNEDLSLYVYGNLTINNLITTKFGPGVQYEVCHPDHLQVLRYCII